MKKMLAIVLAMMMVLSMVPMAVAETAEPALVAEKGLVIYGSSTDIGGDFAPTAWWTNGATDMMIRDMTNDYATVTTNQGGEYVVNETIVTNMESVENDEGTKT
ncbi:MAG: hypothetical protein IJ354_00905 [Clostridia bacterium]|nr:hypothetical protein [Clostridia bacterium]